MMLMQLQHQQLLLPQLLPLPLLHLSQFHQLPLHLPHLLLLLHQHQHCLN
jgi:hypothetical protein